MSNYYYLNAVGHPTVADWREEESNPGSFVCFLLMDETSSQPTNTTLVIAPIYDRRLYIFVLSPEWALPDLNWQPLRYERSALTRLS